MLTQEYVDALIAQRDRLIEEYRQLKAEHESMAKALDSANASLHATKNYRLQTVATPIMAALMVLEENETKALENDGGAPIESLARIACQAGEALLREIDERHTP